MMHDHRFTALVLFGSTLAAGVAPIVADPAPLGAQQDRPALAEQVEAWVDAHQGELVGELVDFLSLPNVASDVEAMHRNAAALVQMMERRGIQAEVLDGEGPPIVLGELMAEGAETTLLLYCHYDGQPVDPATWEQPDPFTPVLRSGSLEEGGEVLSLEGLSSFEPGWRLYGRSASDDKSPIVAILAALDALRDAGLQPTVNLKFIFEGDEEMGSPQLPDVVREHGEDRLAADMVLMVDGPEHPSLRPTIVHGMRGITSARIVLYGADRSLHSGHHGNWAPNPAMELARLLAGMKDEEGRVTIDGWYDDVLPLGEAEQEAIAALEPERPEDYGFAVPEGGPGARRLERIALPSLNVRGMGAAWVGDQVRTIVPDSAVAELDLRLVPDVQPADQIERLVAHVRGQGFHVVSEPPDQATRTRYAPRLAWIRGRDGGYPATRTPLDHPIAQRIREAVDLWLPEEPAVMPMMGGSVPAVWFAELADIPVLLLPIVNPDNNQHSPNENLRLGNFFDGIVTLAAVMRM